MFRSSTRRLWVIGTVVAIASSVAAMPALAGDWRTTFSVRGTATLTDNVDLEPSGEEDPDLYVTLTPSIGVSRQGARLRADVVYAPSITAYLSDGSTSGANALAANASLEAIRDFFFIDATASVRQTFLTPFGALPADVGLDTGNRAETYGLSVSPYIKGTFGQAGTYEVRNRVAYTATDSDLTRSTTYVNWSARAGAPFARRLNWTLEANRNDTSTQDRPDESSSIVRAILGYQVNPDLSVSARAGYETNDYGFTDSSNSLYGVGLNWTPTPRTSISGYVEDRFFGTGYQLSASHRRRSSSFSLYGSRDVSSYPQQFLFTLPAGDTRSLMDAALTARIPDPAERAAAVQQLINATGTPAALFVPTTFYFEQNNLVERVGASLSLLGVRNTVVLAATYVKSEPVARISGEPLPPALATANRYQTYSGSISWSRRLTGKTSSNVLVSRYYTEQLEDTDDNSTNTLVRLLLTTRFTPKTSGSVGLRWSIFDSSLGSLNDYTEHAIFATALHTF